MQQTSEVSGATTWKYRCWLYRSNKKQRKTARTALPLCLDASRQLQLLLLLMMMMVKISVRRKWRDWRAVVAAAVLPLVGRSGDGRGGAEFLNHGFSFTTEESQMHLSLYHMSSCTHLWISLSVNVFLSGKTVSEAHHYYKECNKRSRRALEGNRRMWR